MSQEGKNRKAIAFSVTNCICFDQRVMKMADAVREMGCDVTITGRKLGDCCKKNLVPFKTKRFTMLFKKGFLFYACINLRLFLYLLFNKYDILVANDLDTLLPNYLVSRLKKKPLVFDSHEYFTGVPELVNRPFIKNTWKSIERWILPRLKYVITVSDSIAEKYKSEYDISPVVIRNLARNSESITGYTRYELGIKPEDLILIFQGSGLNIDRGGEELIDAISITPGVTLVVVGSGDILDVMKQKVMENNISDRVIFIPKLSWENMMRYTKGADVGISIDKDTNLNYYFSLPNKLFEYISAGLAVITSALPEVKKMVEDNRCGIVLNTSSPEEISRSIKILRDDRQLLYDLKKNSRIASEKINWENESKKIYSFYKNILL